MLAEVLERAQRDPTLEQILITVASGQHATKRLYREFGFTTYGTEPNAVKVGDAYVDEDHLFRRIRWLTSRRSDRTRRGLVETEFELADDTPRLWCRPQSLPPRAPTGSR
jgi:hypothetical protein